MITAFKMANLRCGAWLLGLCRCDHVVEQKLRDQGKLLFGQVPALELQDGTVLVQTIAIMRFLARVAPANLELYPSDPVKAALVDSIEDQWADTAAGYQVHWFTDPNASV
jgi:hypothetical protein